MLKRLCLFGRHGNQNKFPVAHDLPQALPNYHDLFSDSDVCETCKPFVIMAPDLWGFFVVFLWVSFLFCFLFAVVFCGFWFCFFCFCFYYNDCCTSWRCFKWKNFWIGRQVDSYEILSVCKLMGTMI